MPKQWTASDGKKPRLLLVDDVPSFLPPMAKQMEALGFEVVPHHCAVVADTIKFAMDPRNRIDAVLTDLTGPGNVPYGTYVVTGLKKSGFNGPIAVHSGDDDEEWMDMMAQSLKKDGAVGLFKRGQWTEIAEAIHSGLGAGQSPV